MIATALTPSVLSFLAGPGRYATIATVNRDGSPHQVLTWYLLRDDAVVLNSRVARRWSTNALRDPRVTVTVSTANGDYMTLAGTLEPTGDRQSAQDDIAAMARRYQPEDVAQRNIETYRVQERMSFVLRPHNVHGDTE